MTNLNQRLYNKMIERSNSITRKMRNDRIEEWLKSDSNSWVFEHHVNFTWGKH